MRYEDLPYSLSKDGYKTSLIRGRTERYLSDPNPAGSVTKIQVLTSVGEPISNPNWHIKDVILGDITQKALMFAGGEVVPDMIILNLRGRDGTLLGRVNSKLSQAKAITDMDVWLSSYRSHLRTFGYTYEMTKAFCDLHFSKVNTRTILRPNFNATNTFSLSIHNETNDSILTDICSDRTMVPRLRVTVMALAQLKNLFDQQLGNIRNGLLLPSDMNSMITRIFTQLSQSKVAGDLGNNGYNNNVALSAGVYYFDVVKNGITFTRPDGRDLRLSNAGGQLVCSVLSLMNSRSIVSFGVNLDTGKMFFDCKNFEMKIICDELGIEVRPPYSGSQDSTTLRYEH